MKGSYMYRIFIVEDDDVIAGEIARRLENWGFKVFICDDFRNVLSQFIACDPQLVTDITGAVKYAACPRCL